LDKSPDAFRTISEVADGLDVPQHVLRFWESRFPQIRPMKRAGGRRYYRPEDVDLLRGIRHLLYGEGYTIRGVQRILREQGPKFVQAVWEPGAAQPLPADDEADEDAAFAEDAAPAIEAVTPRITVSDGVSLTRESAEHAVGLSAEDMNKLQRALSELAVCRQLMDDVLKDEAA
jgi:DNA-binding transcriptional MerR regulator